MARDSTRTPASLATRSRWCASTRASGPFTGGNVVQLRGSGFTDQIQVTFGTQAVQPAEHQLVDARRVNVVVPANMPGIVDVTATVGDDTIVLEDGYTYQQLSVTPDRGSLAGGTFVTLTGMGTDFAEGDEVFFGRGRCNQVTVVSETRITCLAPAGTDGGVVSVSVGREGVTRLVAEDAYTYFDTSDSINGGLGGGPIDNAINISVFDSVERAPVPGAYVIVGEDTETSLQGLTDSLGQITLSQEVISPPVTVHIGLGCFEATSFHLFDARDVTVFLVPHLQDPICFPPNPGGGGGGGGRGVNGALIQGQLVWPSDVGRDDWWNLPEAPSADWERQARVFRARTVLRDPQPPGSPPPPDIVLESDIVADGTGYGFSLFTYPGGAAVYAIAGLANRQTGDFVPYLMGVARDVLAGPGETLRDVEIRMDIPLDHFLEVQLDELPSRTPRGPSQFKVQANMDLGGEGFIISGQFIDLDNFGVPANPFDVIRFPDASEPFRFIPTPALQGALSDGRYRVEAGWYTSDFVGDDGTPLTAGVENGVRAVDETFVFDDFLGIPQPVSPPLNGTLPEDRILRWEADGPPPSFYFIRVTDSGTGLPLWRHFVPGDLTEAAMPDLSGVVEGFPDPADGPFQWTVWAISIEGFDFDQVSYRSLNSGFWRRWAIDSWAAFGGT